jgi:mono/diheme cytochrome c family protein
MLFSKKLAGAGVLALAAGLASHAAYAQDEQGDPSPFPQGKNAMLVKQTCSQCHTPNVVMAQTFNEKTARKIYQKMLGESPDTERGKKIVEYLTTYMGEKAEGEQK